MANGLPRVKNKAASSLQISAEQILLEAYENREGKLKVSEQKISDLEELHEFQNRKRNEFENALKRNKLNIGQWIRYAEWELEQKEFLRSKSIFERALDIDIQNVPLWLKYINSELKYKNINHARNLLDRATTILPMVDKFWFLYVQMEEMLGNIIKCREVFERWLSWQPVSNGVSNINRNASNITCIPAWNAYINMEKRYGNIGNIRKIYKRLCSINFDVENWIKWAKFENEYGTSDDVREVYTGAIDFYVNSCSNNSNTTDLIISFAKWECKQKEFERTRAIYKFGLENKIINIDTKQLFDEYSKFEKQFGDKDGIENIVLNKRKIIYKEKLKKNPYNYDNWFSYINLLQDSGSDFHEITDTFEKSISFVPKDINNNSQISYQKHYWRRYIYLWIKYAIWEEIYAKNIEKTREIYKQCLNIIPHKHFTFSKIWLLFAKFEIRNGTVSSARKILGNGIGKCPKPKLFKEYINLEISLKEFDRCRKIYEKFLQVFPYYTQAWIDFTEFEENLGDYDRVRAIYEIAINQDDIQMPELIWKKFIEFESDQGEYDNARNLYERLLEISGHVKVWISRALFELTADQEEENDNEEVTESAKNKSRDIFQRAHTYLQNNDLKEERVVLLNAWKQFEQVHGSSEDVNKVSALLPKILKKRRKLDDGTYEEYLEYLFPQEEESNKKKISLLEMAHAWKASQMEKASNGSDAK